jgi:hypothetical protein
MAPRLGFILTIIRRAGNGKDLLPGCPVLVRFLLTPHRCLTRLTRRSALFHHPRSKGYHPFHTLSIAQNRLASFMYLARLLFHRKRIAFLNVRAWTQNLFSAE